MNDSINKLVDTILKAIDTRQAKKPKGYTTQAKVIRVENGTAWVHMPGGAEETPVKETISCRPGDTVQVHIENGTATLTGNGTSPPTDDKAANAAQKSADNAAEIAAAGKEKADLLSQFFWFLNGTGSEAGAHVTEIPEEEFRKRPRGGNLLLRSSTVRIRLGQQILSELTDNRVTLASGKAVVKYSEDGSAFGLQDSHRIVVCKGIDEAEVRNDATISSMDITNWNLSKPMAFFNVTHSTINGVKSAGGGLFIFDGSGDIANLRYATMTDSGIFETSGDVHAGPISVYDLDTALDQQGNAIADLQDEFASIVNKFTVEPYSLTLASSTNLAAGGHLEYSVTKTKPGYYPLGVVGFHSDKQATTVRSCYIDEVDSGTCKVHMHIRNDSSNTAQAPITGSVDVLWITLPA